MSTVTVQSQGATEAATAAIEPFNAYRIQREGDVCALVPVRVVGTWFNKALDLPLWVLEDGTHLADVIPSSRATEWVKAQAAVERDRANIRAMFAIQTGLTLQPPGWPKARGRAEP